MAEETMQRMLGIPSDVAFDGKVYKFGPANQAALAEQERAFVALANARVKAVSLDDPTEVEAHRDRVARGHFAVGNPGWISMLQSSDGWSVVYLSMFRVNHADMTMDLCNRVVEGNPDGALDALAEQMPDFFGMAFPRQNPAARAKAVEKAVAAMRAASGKPGPNGTPPS